MEFLILPDKRAVGETAAAAGADSLRDALAAKPRAAIILATGVSQFELLDALVAAPDIDWARVTAFHLDEYVGLPATHPASFRNYLLERFVARLPALGSFVPVEGDDADPSAAVGRLNARIAGLEIDVCFAGIGENCHLAFNDPPADFEIDDPYVIVRLDAACRHQQLGEGWFPTLAAVPDRAISMGIRQIMKSRRLIVCVPDARKAAAVRAAIEGPVTPDHPASILQRHPNCTIFLDPPAASALTRRL